MSVRIRLTRMGRRNRPFYRVVIADSRSRRDGCFIEQIGTYDPIKQDKNFAVKEDRVFHWLKVGALPSDTVKRLLSKEGIMLKWHLETSNLSEDKKKQEFQKWEMAKENKEKAKADKKAAKKVEKVEEVEEVEKAAPAVEKAEEPVEAVESASAEATADVPEVKALEEAPAEEKTEEVVEKDAPVEEAEAHASAEAPTDVPEEVETPEEKEETPKAE